jgi:hypothetical protein
MDRQNLHDSLLGDNANDVKLPGVARLDRKRHSGCMWSRHCICHAFVDSEWKADVILCSGIPPKILWAHVVQV